MNFKQTDAVLTARGDKLEFHGTSFPCSILVTSSQGSSLRCLQQVVRVVLMWLAERGSSHARHTHDLLQTSSQVCHEDALRKTVPRKLYQAL